nr:PKD domain-containing protein [bacterium]
GLVGFADGTNISNSYSIGQVSGDSEVGGLVGFAFDLTINNSYSAGQVSGESGVGGLVGFADGTNISNSYSTGQVSGDSEVGGLVGSSFFGSTISNSYSTGLVSGESRVGGLVGISRDIEVNNSFWDTESTNQATSIGGGTGLTTVEMQTLSTYLDAGWDFENESANGNEDIWKMPLDGGTYPLLSWQNNIIASIYADKIQAPLNENIQFTSNSLGNIDYWEWDFDNDGFIDSYEENPTYSYSQAGIYSVALTVSNDDLESDTCIYQNYIHIYNVDIQNGLYAYYPFDNNADDQSENNLDADVYGASLTTDRFGNEDSAYAFDGLDDYIDCPDGFADFTNGFTLTYWSYQESFNRWSRIIDFGNGSQSDNIILTPAALGQNSLQFQVYRGSSSDNIRIANVIDLDAWTFWVAQVDGSGNAKVYKNNVLIGQDNIGAPNNILRTNNFIGKSNWAADGYYQGKIDDLRIYNRSLYEEEREELYNLVEAIDSPANVTISSQDNQITISWDAVPGATAYKVFASDDPNGEFIDISADGSFVEDPALVSNFSLTSQRNTYNSSSRSRNRISWIISSNSQRKFYRIKAVN